MITLDREELKQQYPALIIGIQKLHVMEGSIYEELFINHTPVVGLCHERGYFVIMGSMFIQYAMEHIITDVDLSLIGRRLKEVIVYDNYQEYESARVRAMSASKDQTGLSLN